MNKLMNVLNQIKFQEPSIAVGGSVGLYLQGINLERDWDTVDLDLTCPYVPQGLAEHLTETKGNDSADMQLSYLINGIKVQVQVTEEREIIGIIHLGLPYYVHTVPYILKWKHHYADKGVQKHIDDLDKIRKLLYLEQIVKDIYIDQMYNV
jgi:hypothetical protein